MVTPAVVLRTHAGREADLVVALLTPRGRIDAYARGARNSKKRFAGGLPAGARGQATIGELRRGSLVPLEGFTATADHLSLGRDLEAFAYAAYVCEVSEQLVVGTADSRPFELLDEALAEIVAREPSDASLRALVLRRFELGLLAALGWLPALDSCGVCGEAPARASGSLAFSAARGGVLCSAHSTGGRGVAIEVVELALDLLAGVPGARELPPATVTARRGLRDLDRELLELHLRAPLRSVAFFSQLPKR